MEEPGMYGQFESRMEGLQLGHAVNLLHGPAPFLMGWRTLSAAPRAPLQHFSADILRTPDSGWQPLCASIHRGADALFERMWDCRVEPLLFELPGFDISPA